MKYQFVEQFEVHGHDPTVSLFVEMIDGGAITVDARVAIHLSQETFHCFVEHACQVAAPRVADYVTRTLNGDIIPMLDEQFLRAASTPMRSGDYDVIAGPVLFDAVRHCGIRCTCPPSYPQSSIVMDHHQHDDHGIYFRHPNAPRASGYDSAFTQEETVTTYRAQIGGMTILVMPLFSPERLDSSRIHHYADQLASGQMPSALGYGLYLSPRCLVVAALDGHHKLAAAAATHQPMGIVAFAATRALENYSRMNMLHGPTYVAEARAHLRALAALDSC